jgi:hypothetical protein
MGGNEPEARWTISFAAAETSAGPAAESPPSPPLRLTVNDTVARPFTPVTQRFWAAISDLIRVA